MTKTRVLIISDTHGAHPKPEDSNDARDDEGRLYRDFYEDVTGYRDPLPPADVAVHCGDLTRLGRTKEFEATFSMLRGLQAPLKLVIAGNHDLMLDDEYWNDNWKDIRHNRTEMWRIIKDAEADGVRYLTEGMHDFDLANGTRLKVYASPYTPAYGGWAFQYQEGHQFDIQPHVDIAVTHGPPKNIFDWCKNGSRAGCPQLFEALRLARPRIHCFGHIHESWGARLAKWRGESRLGDDAEEAIDAEASKVVVRLSNKDLTGQLLDAAGEPVSNNVLSELTEQRGVIVDTTQGEHELSDGHHTLFVNAAIMNWRYRPSQLPWLVNINLPECPAPR
ncbi:calcineurin-like phosphoesterase domain-containing protein [Sarocladium implicatum]|nr:calcineurin-like phosphoesterase domain-containing protein [Sarocladium implicatum]